MPSAMNRECRVLRLALPANFPRLFPNASLRRAVVFTLLWLTLLAAASWASAAERQFILLGEVHDNPVGHQRRLADIEALIQGGMRPAIALEQFDADQADTPAAALKHCPSAACVAQMVGNKRWNWAFYEPVIALAMRYKLPVLAANLSRELAIKVARDNNYAAALEPRIVNAYALNRGVPNAVLAGQRAAVAAGHCGQVPPGMGDGLAMAQIARDAQMAWVMQQAAGRDVLLLAGNGHVRRDVGVPVWLAMTNPAVQIRSVGYLEDSDSTPDAERQKQYDRVVVIPKHERGDPCEKLRQPGTQPAVK